MASRTDGPLHPSPAVDPEAESRVRDRRDFLRKSVALAGGGSLAAAAGAAAASPLAVPASNRELGRGMEAKAFLGDDNETVDLFCATSVEFRPSIL